MANGHGSVTQGTKSPVGKFGRLFPDLPASTFGATDKAPGAEFSDSDMNMRLLGEALTAELDAPKDGPDNEESAIPALFTYFMQFIDHDLTFGPEGTFHTNAKNVDQLIDFRTPDFDLDCVYGRGPDDQPYLYAPTAPGGETRLMLIGEAIGGGTLKNGFDLPRNSAGRALIGDKRNDENVIVSQLQGLFLRFHNRLATDHRDWTFEKVQQQVQWHYQWIVLNDLLPRLVHSSVIGDLQTNGKWDSGKIKLFALGSQGFDAYMPVEFSVAAYRLGHSMIRPGYRLNDAVLLPIFPVQADQTKGTIPLPQGLTGFKSMVQNWGIDWSRFIDIDPSRGYGTDPTDPGFNPNNPANAAMMLANFQRLQFAYRLDTSLVDPLRNLPLSVAGNPPPSLAWRNLMRGVDFGLPSGQDVAAFLQSKGIAVGTIIPAAEIQIGKATGDPTDVNSLTAALTAAANQLKLGKPALDKAIAAFSEATPLWVYILAEAAANQVNVPSLPVTTPGAPPLPFQTPQLGPVGGRIVAETFLALMFADDDSYLNSNIGFEPIWGKDFGLREFVQQAIK